MLFLGFEYVDMELLIRISIFELVFLRWNWIGIWDVASLIGSAIICLNIIPFVEIVLYKILQYTS